MERARAASEESERRTRSLEELYLQHAPASVSLAYLLTGEREMAEDLVQEAFVRLAGRLAQIRNPDTFGAYMRRTIVNLHLSRLRRLKRERAMQGTLRREETSSMPDVAQREDIWTALHRLPRRQRAALVLRYHLDLSERQTGEALGCSDAAVKSLVTRGLRGLRTTVGSEER
jgi:RNA polymerase sigma-70 factor (sigma-E family)